MKSRIYFRNFIFFINVMIRPVITLTLFLFISFVFPFQPQTKAELQTAVDMWFVDNSTALVTYGEMNTWDVSLITDMGQLFEQKEGLNDNIAKLTITKLNTMTKMVP